MSFCTCDAVIDPGTPHHHYRQTDTYGAAPELSADEQATVARFEAAEEPEEIRVERVARAMWEARTLDPWGFVNEHAREFYRRLATAAIAALDPS